MNFHPVTKPILVILLASLLSIHFFHKPVFATNAQKVGSVTGLPIPRFVSLSADKVNVRHGPGQSFPIAWVYQRKGYPVEIIDEWVNWRKIRDPESEGLEGWIITGLLVGKRTGFVKKDLAPIRDQASQHARTIALAGQSLIVRLDSCGREFCYVHVDDKKGWVAKSDLLGTHPQEIFGR